MVILLFIGVLCSFYHFLQYAEKPIHDDQASSENSVPGLVLSAVSTEVLADERHKLQSQRLRWTRFL